MLIGDFFCGVPVVRFIGCTATGFVPGNSIRDLLISLFGGHLSFKGVNWPSQKGRKELPGMYVFCVYY